MMSIDRYLGELQAALPRGSASGTEWPDEHSSTELLEELRGHLEDAAHDLQLAGLNPAQSVREAVRRAGSPTDVAAALARAHTARHTRAPRPRTLIAALLISGLSLALGGGMVAAAYTPVHPAERIIHVQKGSGGVDRLHHDYCPALPGPSCRH